MGQAAACLQDRPVIQKQAILRAADLPVLSRTPVGGCRVCVRILQCVCARVLGEGGKYLKNAFSPHVFVSPLQLRFA